MQRENELEDEVEKYQKLERQWNEKKDKLEVKVNAYSAKVRELETLIASNETKVRVKIVCCFCVLTANDFLGSEQ